MRIGSAAGLRSSSGFAYVLLLMMVAIIAAGAASATVVGAQMSRRSAEQQLLVIGTEFERALREYSGGSSRGPKELTELLRDPRVPGLRRHLRRIFDDPLTGSAEWGVRRNELGGITGVFSLAPGKPIQQSGFAPGRRHFVGAASYKDWVFEIDPPTRPAGPTSGLIN